MMNETKEVQKKIADIMIGFIPIKNETILPYDGERYFKWLTNILDVLTGFTSTVQYVHVHTFEGSRYAHLPMHAINDALIWKNWL